MLFAKRGFREWKQHVFCTRGVEEIDETHRSIVQCFSLLFTTPVSTGFTHRFPVFVLFHLMKDIVFSVHHTGVLSATPSAVSRPAAVRCRGRCPSCTTASSKSIRRMEGITAGDAEAISFILDQRNGWCLVVIFLGNTLVFSSQQRRDRLMWAGAGPPSGPHQCKMPHTAWVERRGSAGPRERHERDECHVAGVTGRMEFDGRMDGGWVGPTR